MLTDHSKPPWNNLFVKNVFKKLFIAREEHRIWDLVDKNPPDKSPTLPLV